MRFNLKPAVAILASALALTACGSADEIVSLADGSTTTTVATTTSSATTTTTTTVRTTTPKPCEDGDWIVRMDANEKNRVLGEGVKAVTSEEFRKEILDFNHRDPRGLFLYYNASPLGGVSPISDLADLYEGRVVREGVCFSELGKQKYMEWATLWKTAKIQTTDSMPSGWTNTGVDQPSGTPTSGEPPKGDTKGWIIVFVDTSGKATGSHGAMKRCGNPVAPKPPAPPGPTDEPTPRCPWNPALPPEHYLCVQPKDPTQEHLTDPGAGQGETPIGTDPGDPEEPIDDETGGATTTSTTRPTGSTTTSTTRPTSSTVPNTTPTTNGTETTVTTFGSG